MSGGAKYQAEVSAWWSCQILLQSRLSDHYTLSDDTYPERIYCESSAIVDDTKITFNDDVVLYAQSKTYLSYSDLVSSKWAQVLSQFYNQYKLSKEKDEDFRLVLYLKKSNRYWTTLASLLNKYRTTSDDTLIETTYTNSTEEQVLTKLSTLISQMEESTLPGLMQDKSSLLKKIYVENLNLDSQSENLNLVLSNIRNNLLLNPDQGRSTWTYINEKTSSLHSQGGNAGRVDLRDLLKRRGQSLKFSVNYREDLQKLMDFSHSRLARESLDGNKLTINSNTITIDRDILQEMTTQTQSYLIVGEAGVGKTGVTLSLCSAINEEKCVWYWPVSSVWGESITTLRTELDLTHSWEDIFKDAVTKQDSVLILDGLDSIKNSQVKSAYIELIEVARSSGVQVIASIRTFDLRYSIDLQTIFSSNVISTSNANQIHEFKSVSHYNISMLNDSEFNQVTCAFPEIATAVQTSSDLHSVLRNIFSLHLLCNLLSSGIETATFTDIRTQANLFDIYWNTRIDSAEKRIDLINALEGSITEIVDAKRIGPFIFRGDHDIHSYLCSTGILREYFDDPLSIPGKVEFGHNLFFDYCAELLYIRPKISSNNQPLLSELLSNEPWSLILRPSIRLLYTRLINQNPTHFWKLILELEKTSISLIQRYLGYLTIVENTFNVTDFNPMLEGIELENERNNWFSVIQGVINTAAHSYLPSVFRSQTGEWWLSFALILINTNYEPPKEYSKRILHVSSDHIKVLSIDALKLHNQASRTLLKYYWDKQLHENPIVRFPIKWICESISAYPSESIEMLEEILTEIEIKRSGYNQAFEISRNIQSIWEQDTSLAIEVYEKYSSHNVKNEAVVPINNSQVLSLLGNKAQQYKSGLYGLVSSFETFLDESPSQASKALFKFVYNTLSVERSLEREYTFVWKEKNCTITPDVSYFWDDSDVSHRNENRILKMWYDYLIGLPNKEDAETTYFEIENIISENKLAVVWRKLLQAGHNQPAFFVRKLWKLLSINRLLLESELRDPIIDCFEAFFPYLEPAQIDEIIESILSLSISREEISEPSRIEELIQNKKLDYLVCIPEDFKTEEVKEYLTEHVDSIRPHERIQSPIGRLSGLSQKEIRRLEGIDVDTNEYNELVESTAFIDSIETSSITQDNYDTYLNQIIEVKTRLTVLTQSIDEPLRDLIENKVHLGFVKLCKLGIVFNSTEYSELLEYFSLSLDYEHYTGSPEQHASFDRNMSYWSSNDYLSSKGVIHLALNSAELIGDTKKVLEQIAFHPNPIVRGNLGSYIWRFIDVWPDFVWSVLERWVIELATRKGMIGVFKMTLISNQNWFWILEKLDYERTLAFYMHLRTSSKNRDSTDLLIHCGHLLCIFGIVNDQSWAKNEIINDLSNLSENVKEIQGILEHCLLYVFPRDYHAFENIPTLIRTQQCLIDIMNKTNNAILGLEPSGQVDQEKINTILSNYSRITTELNQNIEKQIEHWQKKESISEEIDQWWSISEPIFTELVKYPLPRFIYDILRSLVKLSEVEIIRTMKWLAAFCVAGSKMGISNEHLIVDQTMNILEYVITNRSNLVIMNAEFRDNFIEVLDVFLKNGWPRAIQLVIHLESIYR